MTDTDALIRAIVEQKPTATLAAMARNLLEAIIIAPDKYPADIHPLGFVRCKVSKYYGYTLRLHVWPPGQRATQDPAWLVHDHVFSLQSFVVFGLVHNRTYKVDERPDGAKQVFYVEYSQGRSTLVPTQINVNVVMTREEEVRAGSLYSVPLGGFHETIVQADHSALTLAVTDEPRPDPPPQVIGECQVTERLHYDRIVVEPDQFVGMIKDVCRN